MRSRPLIEARPPSPAQLVELCAIVEARTGLIVSEAKRTLVGVRLIARMRELELASLDGYCRLVERSDDELLHVVDLVTTHETSFFRHPHHFAFLEDELLPALRAEARSGRRPHEVRAWSAGCSTGEEPYSLAMALRGGLSARAGWGVHVLASDISEAALARAKAGLFARDKARLVPDEYRKLFVREGAGDGSALRIDPELSELLAFRRINLLDELYPVGRDYDLIFCRNVLIYMRPEARRAVIDRLLGHLAPGGHLFLGQAEGLMGMTRVRRVAPTIYQASSAPASVRPAVQRGGGR